MVLAALSSIFQDQLDVLRRVARALGYPAGACGDPTGRAVDPAAVPAPGNIRVLRAAPHSQVLTEAAAVVTHAAVSFAEPLTREAGFTRSAADEVEALVSDPG